LIDFTLPVEHCTASAVFSAVQRCPSSIAPHQRCSALFSAARRALHRISGVQQCGKKLLCPNIWCCHKKSLPLHRDNVVASMSTRSTAG